MTPVAAAEKIKGEAYRLHQGETGVTASTDAEVEYTLRYDFAAIWKYQVPVNTELFIRPEDHLSMYIENDEAAPAEWRDDQFVRAAIWNPELTKMDIIHEGRYVETKETSDRNKMGHFSKIDAPYRVKPGDWIYLYGKSPFTIYTIDVSDSYFILECLRARPTMFE